MTRAEILRRIWDATPADYRYVPQAGERSILWGDHVTGTHLCPLDSLPELRVGDVVEWRGSWGEMPAVPARVRGITIPAHPGTKDGESVTSIPWPFVRSHSRAVIVDLDNGHWAWGFQIVRFEQPGSGVSP